MQEFVYKTAAKEAIEIKGTDTLQKINKSNSTNPICLFTQKVDLEYDFKDTSENINMNAKVDVNFDKGLEKSKKQKTDVVNLLTQTTSPTQRIIESVWVI